MILFAPLSIALFERFLLRLNNTKRGNMKEGTVENGLNIESSTQVIDDNWELDAAACRIDGHVMAEGEMCEACQ